MEHRNSINTLHSPGPHTAGRRFCAVPPFCAAGANPWRKANSLRPSIELSPGIQKEAPAVGWCFFLEATPRFELGVELLQSSALPLGYVALWITGAILCSCYHLSGAGDEARTRYLHLGKVALYQMSYTRKWCLRSESNQRHGDFQSPALPTELQRHISFVIHKRNRKKKWRLGRDLNPRPPA